jgi:alpha-ribazole phosphatase
MELHLIRHPRVAVAAGLCYGRNDVALSEEASVVARRLEPLLPQRFTLVASPARRCRELAEALSPAPAFDERLLEIDFGAWEAKSFEDIGREAVEAWAADPFGFRPPGGETAAEMVERVLAWLEDCRRLGPGPVVVVAHGGPLRAIAGHLLDMPRERWIGLDFECGHATRLDLTHGRTRLAWFNR